MLLCCGAALYIFYWVVHALAQKKNYYFRFEDSTNKKVKTLCTILYVHLRFHSIANIQRLFLYTATHSMMRHSTSTIVPIMIGGKGAGLGGGDVLLIGITKNDML